MVLNRSQVMQQQQQQGRQVDQQGTWISSLMLVLRRGDRWVPCQSLTLGLLRTEGPFAVRQCRIWCSMESWRTPWAFCMMMTWWSVGFRISTTTPAEAHDRHDSHIGSYPWA